MKYKVFNDADRSKLPTSINNFDIWEINIRTNEIKQLTFIGNCLSPVLSADSTGLFFIWNGQIHYKNLSNNQIIKILNTPFNCTFIINHIQNKSISFIGEKPNTIYIYDLSSKELTYIETKIETIDKIIEITRLSPKAKILVYDKIYDNDWNLLIKQKNEKYPKIITDDKYQDRYPSWINDNIILFVSDRGT